MADLEGLTMDSRKKHLKKVAKDREEGYKGLLDAQDRKKAERPLALRIIEALAKRHEKYENPLGLDPDMPMSEYIKLHASGKLAEMEAKTEYVDKWMTDQELHAAADGHSRGAFDETLKLMRSAHLITGGPFKKTWVIRTMSFVHLFLGTREAGERFTKESLAEFAGEKPSWAAHKLAATTRLRLTRKVGANLYELA